MFHPFLWSPSQIKKWASAEWATYHHNNSSVTLPSLPWGRQLFKWGRQLFFWNPFLVTFWLLRNALYNSPVRANKRHFFFPSLASWRDLPTSLGSTNKPCWNQGCLPSASWAFCLRAAPPNMPNTFQQHLALSNQSWPKRPWQNPHFLIWGFVVMVPPSTSLR